MWGLMLVNTHITLFSEKNQDVFVKTGICTRINTVNNTVAFSVLNGIWVHCHVSLSFLQRETTVVISCLLSWTTVSLSKLGSTL